MTKDTQLIALYCAVCNYYSSALVACAQRCINNFLPKFTDLLGKGIVTRRKNEQSLLMDIRNGKLPFDEIFSLANEFQKKFHEAATQTTLPYEPNFVSINRLMIDIYMR